LNQQFKRKSHLERLNGRRYEADKAGKNR
jgi:hypothetical protein